MSNHPALQTVEDLISGRHVDVTDHAAVTTLCREHSVAEVALRAVIDTFAPLSESLNVYLTR